MIYIYDELNDNVVKIEMATDMEKAFEKILKGNIDGDYKEFKHGYKVSIIDTDNDTVVE